MRAKDAVRELLDRLPDDAPIERILYHVYVLQKIEEGEQAIREGKVIPNEQVMQELRARLGRREEREVVWSLPAKLDLTEALDFISHWSHAAAERFAERVLARAASLSVHPERRRSHSTHSSSRIATLPGITVSNGAPSHPQLETNHRHVSGSTRYSSRGSYIFLAAGQSAPCISPS